MKTQHCLIAITALAFSSLACHAAPGIDSRAALLFLLVSDFGFKI